MYIDRKEVLRYMGYKGQVLDDGIRSLLEVCIGEVESISKKRSTYGIFDMEKNEEGIALPGTTIVLRGEAIGRHLSKAERCAVIAVTLGIEIDKRIALYSRTDLTKGLVFDACASAAVEALCDKVQEDIEAEAEAMGLKITSRFSPGYGDFPLDVQREIVKVLRTYERIGLSVNESGIMIPRKSVTAVIGLQREECDVKGQKCRDCEYKNCRYRKDGEDE